MAVVELDLAEWREIYPQFSEGAEALTDAQLKYMWAIATALVDNSPAARVPYDPPRTEMRKIILYALLCHLGTLAGRGDIVGNVTSAAQGSVNAGLALAQRNNSRWWDQTPCGLTAWTLLQRYALGGCYIRGH